MRYVSIAGALLLALGGPLVVAQPAVAHGSAAVSTSPSADEVLEALPSTIELEFGETLLPAPAAVSVLGPDGTQYAASGLTVSGTNVSVPVAGKPLAGAYKVTYQVVSDDGAAMRASFSFTVHSGATAQTSTADPGSARVTDGTEKSSSGVAAGPIGTSSLLLLLTGVLLLAGGFTLFARRPRK